MTSLETAAFKALADTRDPDGGLSARASAAEAGNFLRHVAALACSKIADGLADAKLVLSWLLTALGAPAGLVGLLVPLREAGALLPQIFTAPRITALARRKWVWAAGSAVQGLAAGGILLAALLLTGVWAGVVILGLVGVLALARSVCSVSYKDVLGRTIGKSRRGSATGLAASAAAFAVVGFALVLMGLGDARRLLVLVALGVAAVLWLLAAAVFATLREEPNRGDAPVENPLEQWRLLIEAPGLGRFVVVRGLLTATALAPPYIVVLAGAGAGVRQLGALVLASATASFLSSYVWGLASDRSGRAVLAAAGITAGAVMAAAVAAGASGAMATSWVAPALLFALMVAYHGVRQARATYLVDMAPEDSRATYSAVANTAIGLVLLAAGGFGALAASAGAGATLALFAALSMAGGLLALTLRPPD